MNYNDSGSTTNSNGSTINIESGAGQPAINVPTGTATLSGAISSTGGDGSDEDGGRHAAARPMPRPATAAGTDNNIDGGFVEVNSIYGGADGYADYTALGHGNLNVAYAGPASGGGLWLNNVQMGVNQNQSKTDTLGWFRMYNGGVLKGTGTGAAVANTNVQAQLNWNGSTTAIRRAASFLPPAPRPATSCRSTTEFEQSDPNYFQANEYVNYTLNNSGYHGHARTPTT